METSTQVTPAQHMCCPLRADFPLEPLLIGWPSHSSNASRRLLLRVVLIHVRSLCSEIHTKGPKLNTAATALALRSLTAMQEVRPGKDSYGVLSALIEHN